jgi:hypothetical protein
MRSLALVTCGLAGLAGSCTPVPEERQLSQQAIALALDRQTTVHLDEGLAWEIQAILDRAWADYPILECLSVWPELSPSRLALWVYDGVNDLPPEVEAAWQEGQLLTGNQEVDLLLEEFHFTSVAHSIPYGISDKYDLWFEAQVNVAHLVEYFLAQTGIALEPIELAGDGDRIVLAQTPQEADVGLGEGWSLRFQKGWGDCPSQCIEEHVWEVFVPVDGPVVLLRESGDLVPERYEPCWFSMRSEGRSASQRNSSGRN